MSQLDKLIARIRARPPEANFNDVRALLEAFGCSFYVIAEPEGGYVIVFPDLPGCMTQVETLDEVGPMATDVCAGWLETAYEQGLDIPLPTFSENGSGTC